VTSALPDRPGHESRRVAADGSGLKPLHELLPVGDTWSQEWFSMGIYRSAGNFPTPIPPAGAPPTPPYFPPG